MTSIEIQELRGHPADHKSDHNALWEIALQLAKLNEHNRLTDPQEPKRDADCEPGGLWPKIHPTGDGRWALWMSPLSEARAFDSEEEAKEHLRTIGRMMNDYVPPAVERDMYPSPPASPQMFALHVIELLLDIDADLDRIQSPHRVRAPGFKDRVNRLRDKLAALASE